MLSRLLSDKNGNAYSHICVAHAKLHADKLILHRTQTLFIIWIKCFLFLQPPPPPKKKNRSKGISSTLVKSSLAIFHIIKLILIPTGYCST